MKLEPPLGLPLEEYNRVRWVANIAMTAFVIVAVLSWFVK